MADKKFAFRLVNGTHEERGKVYGPGMTVSSTRDLKSIFPQKFASLGELAEDDSVTDAVPEDDETAPDSVPVTSALGEDETSDFNGATEAGIRVFRRGAYYYIAAASDTDTSLVEKGMRRNEVEDYIASM